MPSRSRTPKAMHDAKPASYMSDDILEQVTGLITIVRLRTALLILRNELVGREEIRNSLVKDLKGKWDDLAERSLTRFVERDVRETVSRMRERSKREAESMLPTQTNKEGRS